MEEIDAWLAQLEMEADEGPITMNQHHYYRSHQQDDDKTIMERSSAVVFDEELAVALGQSAYPDHHLSGGGESNGNTNTNSSASPHDQLDFDYSLLDLQAFSHHTEIDSPSHHILPNIHDNQWQSSPNDPLPLDLGARSVGVPEVQHHQSAAAVVGDDHNNISKKADHGRGGATSKSTAKRKREPSQVQDHIMAERKRRELLSTQFISLSAIVPGLKKTDKTSVLGEAIKYMKELKEKVKALEEEAAKRTVESVVVVKKSQLVVADDGGAVDDNDASSSVDDNCTGGSGGGGGECLPEIEVKVSDKSILIKVYCEKQKGMLAKLFREVEKLGFNVINCSVIPFGTLALDISILAQIEKELNVNVKDLIRSLDSVLSPAVG